MATINISNWWSGAGRDRTIYQILTGVLAIICVLAPHGYPQGRAAYLGHPHSNHLYSHEWRETHEWYSRTCVLAVCLLCYTAGVSRFSSSSVFRSRAKKARAVVTILIPLLLIYGQQITRLGDIGTLSHTGWGLWMLVPLTLLSIS